LPEAAGIFAVTGGDDLACGLIILYASTKSLFGIAFKIIGCAWPDVRIIGITGLCPMVWLISDTVPQAGRKSRRKERDAKNILFLLINIPPA
jgi:hypothetical protein